MNPWMSRRVIGWAHQGGDERRPNTIEAMRRALAMGIHALEFDVHRTADDVLVIHHDPVLKGSGERIAATSLEDLRSAKPDLATLEEALTAFPGVPMTIECKAEDAATPLARRLSQEGDRPLIVTSFKPGNLRAMKQAAQLDSSPAWTTVLAAWAASRIGLPLPGAGANVAFQVALRFDQVPVLMKVPLLRRLRFCDARFVKAAHKRGLAVHVWTLNEPEEIREALATGADGIMTNVPAVLMEILEAEGVSDARPG